MIDSMYLMITIAIGIIILISYSIIVHSYKPKEKWPWWHTCVSTLGSTLLAFGAALILWRLQQAEELESRQAMLKELLQAEIAVTLETLTFGYNLTSFFDDSTQYVSYLGYIQPIAFEDAARTGQFAPDVATNLLAIASQIREYNRHVEYFNTVRSFPNIDSGYRERLKSAAKRVELERLDVIKSCNNVADYMQLRRIEFADSLGTNLDSEK